MVKLPTSPAWMLLGNRPEHTCAYASHFDNHDRARCVYCWRAEWQLSVFYGQNESLPRTFIRKCYLCMVQTVCRAKQRTIGCKLLRTDAWMLSTNAEPTILTCQYYDRWGVWRCWFDDSRWQVGDDRQRRIYNIMFSWFSLHHCSTWNSAVSQNVFDDFPDGSCRSSRFSKWSCSCNIFHITSWKLTACSLGLSQVTNRRYITTSLSQNVIKCSVNPFNTVTWQDNGYFGSVKACC